MRKKIIYLPIEVKPREYHAKLLLALYALSRDYQVVLGSKWTVDRRIASMPEGIYVGSGVTKVLGNSLLEAQKHGHKSAAFDEEGLSYINRDNFMQNRITEDIIRQISHFFTWGEHHSELVYKKDSGLTNVTATGNMRLELLKPQYHSLYNNDVKAIKKRYGEFILINSNLKVFNNVVGREKYFNSLRNVTFIQNDEDETFYKDRYLHQEEIFESYKSLIISLAPVIKPVNIVIRPHTSENKKTWEELDIPGVYVDNTGGVVPWISASKAVIQKNCTTAVETAYLNRPVITYSIKHDPRFDNDITRNIGILCDKENQAIDAVKSICGSAENDTDNPQVLKDREFLRHYASNMEDGENVAAAVLDILDKIDLPLADDNYPRYREARSAEYYLDIIRKKATAIAGKKTPERQYKKQKFPYLTHSELKRDIALLSDAVNIAPGSVLSAQIGDDMYHMTKNDI